MPVTITWAGQGATPGTRAGTSARLGELKRPKSFLHIPHIPCRGSGWDLAAIGPSTENTALEKILLDYCEAEQGDLALCCFLIGGYNINSPSDMQWTTGESASYFNWSEYYEEPNDLPGSCLYNCVENYFGISGEWGDKDCNEVGTTKYLCEKH